MSIDPETLMAYADGELDMLGAKRVEKAIAVDPALAEQVEKHRRLRATLSGAFDPLMAVPVPDRLEAMIRESAKVVPIEAARKSKPPTGWWRNAGAVAAALAVGLFAGQLLRPSGDFTSSDGRVIASGQVGRALDGQLAATQGDAPVKVLISFRTADKSYCRAFEMETQTGLACHKDGSWQVRQLHAGAAVQKTEYRQAGSSEILGAAQAMMVGDPLDALGEEAAKARNWRP